MNLFEKEFEKVKGRQADIFTFDVNQFCYNLSQRKRPTDKEKIDALLELDATLYMNLGSDSTMKEKAETKKKSRIIYRAIKVYDETLGSDFLKHQDKS